MLVDLGKRCPVTPAGNEACASVSDCSDSQTWEALICSYWYWLTQELADAHDDSFREESEADWSAAVHVAACSRQIEPKPQQKKN
jgi:hypothetical protein